MLKAPMACAGGCKGSSASPLSAKVSGNDTETCGFPFRRAYRTATNPQLRDFTYSI
jgi:hypothetical protein